tara:strand:+ start:892 stop:1593 length:702 start_codon:yes stop_codon:yes gene_type:complete
MNTIKLTDVEKGFFNSKRVNKWINLDKITKLKSDLSTMGTKRFDKSLQLAQAVYLADASLKDAEVMQEMKETGVELSKKILASRVFGISDTYYRRLKKAGKHRHDEPSTVKNFLAECDRMEKGGEMPKRSVDAFLKWVKDEETGGKGSGKVSERATAQKSKTLFTMTFKDAGMEKGTAVRVDDNYQIHTANSPQEIKKALEFFIKLMNEQASGKAQKEVEAEAERQAKEDMAN